MSKAKTDGALATIEPTQVSVDDIRARIFTVRGVQVILDRDLAALYGVQTGNLNKAVSRNAERFPEDFMFQLTKEESLRFQIGTSKKPVNTGSGSDTEVLRFQSGTLKLGQGKHFKYQPYAFTENGIVMLSSVLKSERAQAHRHRALQQAVRRAHGQDQLAAKEIPGLKGWI